MGAGVEAGQWHGAAPFALREIEGRYGAANSPRSTPSSASAVMGPTYLRTMRPCGSMKCFSGMPVRP